MPLTLPAVVGLVFAAADSGDTTGVRARVPRLLTDVAAVTGVTLAWGALNPDVRRGVLAHGSLGHVAANFASPIRRALQGARDDHDGFATNYIAHPVSWALLGLYLRQRGYSRRRSLVFTQVHSIAWEYVVEGSYMKPSGKDLLANAAGAAVAIYWPRGAPAAPARSSTATRVLDALNPLRSGTLPRLGVVPLDGRPTWGIVVGR